MSPSWHICVSPNWEALLSLGVQRLDWRFITDTIMAIWLISAARPSLLPKVWLDQSLCSHSWSLW